MYKIYMAIQRFLARTVPRRQTFREDQAANMSTMEWADLPIHHPQSASEDQA